jgi:5-methyltetrahydrofolate--homocysteine methyltransferase
VTDTIISSATKEVIIGFDRPFVIIGERINPTGRKIMAAEMMAGDYSRVIADALAQVEAGAHMLDVNAWPTNPACWPRPLSSSKA